MLTTLKKALILAQAGIDVPRFPGIATPGALRQPHDGLRVSPEHDGIDTEQALAVKQWNQDIEILFVAYAAARAAKSLREAEQARQMDMLRRANAQPRKSF